jgi:hypothetical protein
MSLKDLIMQRNAATECRRIALAKKEDGRRRIKELFDQMTELDKETSAADASVKRSDEMLSELNYKIWNAERRYENPRAIFDRLWAKELTLKIAIGGVTSRYNEVRHDLCNRIGAQTLLIVDKAANLEEARKEIAEYSYNVWNDYLKNDWICISCPGYTIDELLAA